MVFRRLAVYVCWALVACGDGAAIEDAASNGATVVDSAPPPSSNSGNATFSFHADGADHFECQLDATPAVTCTSPYSVAVADGSHTLTITAFKGAVELPNPAVIIWLVDTTPPDTMITSSPAAFDNSTTTQFSFVGIPASDTSSFTCSLDGASFLSCTSPTTITTVAGDHTFDVRATDAFSNVDPTPAHWSWTIDTTIIDTMITSGPAMDSSTQGAVAFTFTATDPLATFECQIDTSLYAPCTTPAEFVLSEGAHTFTVRARHGANIDPTPASRTWTVDTTAPTVTITGHPSDPSNDATPSFTFSSPDPTATFECQVYNNGYAACTSPWTAGFSLVDGPVTFRVRATDRAANSSFATYSWDQDRSPPVVSLDQVPPNGDTSPTVTFAFSTEENNITFECEIDGVVAYTACTSPWSYLVAGGSQTFHLRATDLATNQTVKAWTWTENLPGPTVAITGGPPSSPPQNVTTQTFTFSTAGSPTMIDCSFDGAPYVPCGSPVTYTGLADGSHTFIVRVRDNALNTSTATRTFTIDTIPPTVTITGGPGSLTSDRTPTFTYTATDTSQVGFSVDSTGYAGQGNVGSFTSPPLGDGLHAFHIVVYDAAGNSAHADYDFTLDTIGPSLTVSSAPTDPSYNSLASFVFSAADAVGFSCQLDDVAFTACTSPFNAFVADGFHTVRIRASDAAGAQTQQTITWETRAQPRVTVSAGTFDTGQSITISWTGLPGNMLDWISYAPAGSSDTTVTQRVYVNGQTSGTATLPGTATAGSYVARAYSNDTFTKIGESTLFATADLCPILTDSGSTSIHNAGDMAGLAHYTTLGDLSITTTVDLDVTLPCLTSLRSLTITDNGGTHRLLGIHLPRLQTISGDVEITNGPPAMEAPGLISIGGELRDTQSSPLVDVSSLAHLTTLGTLRIISDSSATLGPDAFPSVTSLPAISIQNSHLTGFNSVTTATKVTIVAGQIDELNRLAHVSGTLDVAGAITGLKSLKAVDGDATFTIAGPQTTTLESLQTVGGTLDIKVYAPSGSSTATVTLALPSMMSAYLFILEGIAGASSDISTLYAPLFTQVTYQVVMRNLPQFSVCSFRKFLDQLWPQPYFNDQEGLTGLECN